MDQIVQLQKSVGIAWLAIRLSSDPYLLFPQVFRGPGRAQQLIFRLVLSLVFWGPDEAMFAPTLDGEALIFRGSQATFQIG